jgi:hypothetical protein
MNWEPRSRSRFVFVKQTETSHRDTMGPGGTSYNFPVRSYLCDTYPSSFISL